MQYTMHVTRSGVPTPPFSKISRIVMALHQCVLVSYFVSDFTQISFRTLLLHNQSKALILLHWTDLSSVFHSRTKPHKKHTFKNGSKTVSLPESFVNCYFSFFSLVSYHSSLVLVQVVHYPSYPVFYCSAFRILINLFQLTQSKTTLRCTNVKK